jgi:HD-like signal output (HDOD) protein
MSTPTSVTARIASQAPATALRLALIHDGENKALAILPRESIMDLEKLSSLSKKRYRTVSKEKCIAFFSQQGLKRDEGVMQLLKMTSIVVDPVISLENPIEVWEPYSDVVIRILPEWLVKAEVIRKAFAVNTQLGNGKPFLDLTDRRFSNLRFKHQVVEHLDMPPLSSSIQELILLRSDPDATVADLSDIIRQDPSLSAQVVSWANSPYYGSPKKVDSIEDAIIRVLGFDLTINLALGVSMGEVLQLPELQLRGASPFWQQSLATASSMEKFARELRDPDIKPGQAYLTGIIHDLGYLVLFALFPQQFARLVRTIGANPHIPYRVIERHVFKVTREEVGVWVLDSWGLPRDVCQPIACQNRIDDERSMPKMATLLHAVLNGLRAHGMCDGPIDNRYAAELQGLGVPADRVGAIFGEIVEKRGEILESISVFTKAA